MARGGGLEKRWRLGKEVRLDKEAEVWHIGGNLVKRRRFGKVAEVWQRGGGLA